MSFSQSLRKLGQPIAYYPQLAKPLGGVTAAILFGQLFFWQDKTLNPLGVYKTQAELEQETGLSRREQETARKKLVELGILIETHKRLEHRIYFRLDLAKFDALMDDIREATNPPFPNGTTEHSPMAESDIREATNPPSVNTENTTENTNNNTFLTESINTHPKKSPDLILLEQFGITGDLAEDFAKHRKTVVKAPITKRAMDMLAKQAEIAGIPITLAVEIVLAKSTWTSFQADFSWQSTAMALGWKAPITKNLQNPPARNTSSSFIPDDEENWGEGKTITLRGN